MKWANMRAENQHELVRWEVVKDGVIPENAIPGGNYPTGEKVFLGRGKVRQNRHEYVPGYIVPSMNMLIVAYGTGTKLLRDYEVLVSDHQEYLHWRKASSVLPLRPVTGGCDSKGYEPYYLGRTCTELREGRTWRGRRIDNEYKNYETQLPGKIHLSHNCLYVGFDEKEYIFKDYEVLSTNGRPRSLEEQCLLQLKVNLEDLQIKQLRNKIPETLHKKLLNIVPN